jgi:hypothetical protein
MSPARNMSPARREKQLRRYFQRPKPVRHLLLRCILLVPIPFVIGRLLMNVIRRSSFSDYDIDQIVEDALERGKIDAEQQLFGSKPNRSDTVNVVSLFSAYIPRNRPTAEVPREDMLARRSKRDGFFRFSAYRFVYVYPTMHYLSLYSTQYNVLTDRIDQGYEQEYPYRHIVSIEAGPYYGEVLAKQGRLQRPDRAGFVAGHWFRIVNAGGEDFQVGVIYEDLVQAARGEELKKIIERGEVVKGLERLDSNFNDARKRIRDVLRQKEEAAQIGRQGSEWSGAASGPPLGGAGSQPDWGPPVNDPTRTESEERR